MNGPQMLRAFIEGFSCGNIEKLWFYYFDYHPHMRPEEWKAVFNSFLKVEDIHIHGHAALGGLPDALMQEMNALPSSSHASRTTDTEADETPSLLFPNLRHLTTWGTDFTSAIPLDENPATVYHKLMNALVARKERHPLETLKSDCCNMAKSFIDGFTQIARVPTVTWDKEEKGSIR